MSGFEDRLRAATEGARGLDVLLSANPIHDTGGGQRSAQFALELLARDHAVVFVSHGRVTETVDLSLRYEQPRLVRLTLAEAVGPARAALIEALNGPGLDGRGQHGRYGRMITQVPVAEWLPVLWEAARKGAVTVYDCIDRWGSELGRGWYSPDTEARIAAASGVLTASAPALVDHLETMTGRQVHLLPNAYNARVFDPEAAHLSRPKALDSGARVALYVGALWGGWMDWRLVARLARALPDTRFVFVGDHRGEGRRLPANCVFEGLKPQTELPPYLAHADVAFLPWRRNELTEATSPLKVYEFLAMGLPVVGPDIEPIRDLPGVYVASSAQGFVEAVRNTDRGSIPPEERSAMRRCAEKSSWGQRVDRLAALGDRSERPVPAGARRTGAFVSVVIPAFEHERFVGEAIDSALGQSLPAGEIVVVDDGSSDGTAVVAADRLSGARGEGAARLIRQGNRGAHHALNRAIRLSRGEWIAILNSDDVFEPERLEHAWSVARERNAAMVVGSVGLIDGAGAQVEEGHEIARWYREALEWARSGGSLGAVLRRHNVAVTTSNFFLHREVWRRLGGFRAYRYVHDYDFLIRAVEMLGNRVVYDERLCDVRYRVHSGNTITGDRDRAAEEREAMRRSLAAPTRRLRRAWAAVSAGRATRRLIEAAPPLDPARDARGPRSSGAGEPVRVGLVVESLGTGGLEEVVALLARALPASGMEVRVLCVRDGGPVAERLQRAGVAVEVLRGRASRAAEWAARERVTIASSHFAPLDAVRSLADAGVPVVETVQNCYAWLTDTGWAEERRRVGLTRGVIAVSELAAAYYARHAGYRPEWIVPNAVHPARAARMPRPVARDRIGVDDARPVFTFVGRITEQKNPAGLLRAFSRLVDERPDAVLVLAGPSDGSAPLSTLRARHRELFRKGAVRHLPSVKHVGTVLSAADAFVSNAFYEGWSVAVSEALWVGLPIVVSETGGSSELAGADGDRGIVVPNACGEPLSVTQERIRTVGTGAQETRDAREANESCLAAALAEIAASPDRWWGRQDATRTWAREHVSPETIARRYAEVLESVLRS